MLLAAISGCGAGSNSGRAETGPDGSPASAPIDADSLAADRLRIHPLTRFSRETAGSASSELQLVCHLELKDRYGHNLKSLGRARVELYRPVSAEPGAAMVETQDLVWEVDLRDADKNALLYDDLVTRTYVLQLGGLPEWVVRWHAGESREPWVTLKANFLAINCLGKERRLEATYRIQR